MDQFSSLIRFRGVPLEAWLALPVIILALYVIFRLKRFGEDSFTWNHTYLKRAVAFGMGVWFLSYLSGLPPEYWQRFLIWAVVTVGGVLAMDYWGGEGFFRAATLTLLMVFVGVTAMPLPRAIGYFIYGKPEFVAKRETKSTKQTRSFVFNFPPGWQEVPGKLSRTYRSPRPGAGFFQISMHPALEGKVDGPRAEKELDSLLKEMKSDMPFGKRLTIGHVPSKVGYLAYATYQSEEHGVLGFWLLPGDDLVFATYVDGGPAASEPDIREAQKAMESAHFE